MAIIVEGLDATGKSTLGRYLASELGLAIQESEGPAKSFDEIHHRIERYAEMVDTLFVRHPCVSQQIYYRIQTSPVIIDEQTLQRFYRCDHTFIYCEPNATSINDFMSDHQVKAHDTPEFVDHLKNNYWVLLDLYRKWAFRHAHFIYRIGDSQERLLQWLS